MREGNIKNKKRTSINNEINDNIFNEEEIDVIEQPLKKKNKINIVILIIFTAICVLVTGSLILFKYIEFDKQVIIDEPILENKVNIDKDLKYIVSFSDMYEINPLTIAQKNYDNGSVNVDGVKEDKVRIDYIQISGLKNGDIQSKINEEIKNAAFSLIDKATENQQYFVYTQAMGNFSNILSVGIDIIIYENNDIVYDETICLNYNLTNGEKIKFLDLFVASTPMNSIIADIKYEALAWDTEINFDMSEKEWEQATNMDYRDTSKYEDEILMAINRYKAMNKDEIKFVLSPNEIRVFLPLASDGKISMYSIHTYKYIDYITVYKKYQTNENIYQTNIKDKLLVFQDYNNLKPYYYKLESDNLFIRAFLDDIFNDEESYNNEVQTYTKKVMELKEDLTKKQTEEAISKAKKLANKNNQKGYLTSIFTYSYIDTYENEWGAEPLIYVGISSSIYEMSLEKYKTDGLKILAEDNVAPRADVDSMFVAYLNTEKYKVKELKNGEEPYLSSQTYYDTKGNIVAHSYDEVQEYINNKYKEEIIEKTDKDIGIYEEE